MTARVLIVEDDPDVQLGLQLRMRAAGYETLSAEDGPNAYTVAVREKPDLIILDLGLPGEDGLSVLGRLRESGWTARPSSSSPGVTRSGSPDRRQSSGSSGSFRSRTTAASS